MSIDPSSIIYFQYGFIKITATLVFTWVTMGILIVLCLIGTRGLKTGKVFSVGQNVAEFVVVAMESQVKGIAEKDYQRIIPFVGTLFLFIFVSNVMSVVPGYTPPTASMNTTIALAVCVFFAVPLYGIASKGIGGYFRQYIKPSVLMLPFNIIGEISRTISLSVRLYGNVMSLTIIVAILLGVIPLFFPLTIQLLGIVTGAIQAYIFAVLATVYIAAAVTKEGG